MSKHINTHLFFHLNDSHSAASGKSKSGGGIDASSARKPAKKSSNLFSGFEIDNNPPLPAESGDYYDYYTNYGIPEYHGPFTPPGSPLYYGEEHLSNYEYKNNEYYRDFYENGDSADYRADPLYLPPSGPVSGGLPPHVHYNAPHTSQIPHHQQTSSAAHGYAGDGPYTRQTPNTLYPHPSAVSGRRELSISAGNLYDPRRASPTSPTTDPFAYRSDHQQGLSAISHKLHRITFVEACIFQPPELSSPSSSRPPPSGAGAVGVGSSSGGTSGGTGGGPSNSILSMGPIPAVPPRPTQPPASVPPTIAQGERSPTSTGGTQYYQEWTSKHMRHLCGRFEKPAQQQLLMNVERKSKYPFIILCTPETSNKSNCSLSKSSSSASSNKQSHPHQPYRREMSHHSNYLNEEDVSDDENCHEESRWITQKQRDSINHHFLPPPPPPLVMPHIWPEIRYIDGLYTVCASITRPGSGMPDEPDDSFTLESTSFQRSLERHISFQDDRSDSGNTTGGGSADWRRPTGYIVSGFATFPGEDSERLERNWLMWTGARVLYKYLPMSVGLRRMIFLKRCPDMYREEVQNKMKPTIFTGFTYVLLCECFNLKSEYIASVCTTIDQLRARCCGYSALYLTHFQQSNHPLVPIHGHLPQHHHPQMTPLHHPQMHHPYHPHHPQPQSQHPLAAHYGYDQQHSTSSASNSSGQSTSQQHSQQQQSHHHSHHIPRHHRSQEFTDFG